MTDFERQSPSYRLVETHHGDDLQAVAAREMGDANRWPELVWLNNLIHPYLTDHADRVTANVLLTGSLLRVPAPVGVYTDEAESGQVYERDLVLTKKLLSVDANGDYAIVAGVSNLTQQLSHRINTPRGQLRRHPEYGCLVWRLLGRVSGPVAGALGAQYVKAALLADYRVARVNRSVADVLGDTIKVTATAEAIEGGAVDLTTSAGSS